MNCNYVMSVLSKKKSAQLLEESVMIDKVLLAVLACPVCKADVEEREDKVVCVGCGRKYPIKDGIPVMLADAAE
jgi:uncharacterized protein